MVSIGTTLFIRLEQHLLVDMSIQHSWLNETNGQAKDSSSCLVPVNLACLMIHGHLISVSDLNLIVEFDC